MKKLIQLSVLFATVFSFAQNILELNPTNFPVTNPCGFSEFNNKLFYVGTNSTYARELFATDGSIAGNQLVKDIGNQYYSQTNGFLINSGQQADGKFGKFNGKLYFEANTAAFTNSFKLWSTDGTTAGTQMIGPSTVYGPVKHFKEFNGRLYFTAVGWDTGCEIWSTDGTTAGTTLLKDIQSKPNESSIAFNNQFFNPCFTVFNDRLYFVANDGIHGLEIWSTDGTTAGTTLLKDINVGGDIFLQNNLTPYQPFVVYNNRMYFKAYSFIDSLNSSYETLWSTDGTEAGTVKFEVPLPPGYIGPNPTNYLENIQGMTVANNKLYLFCNSQSGGTVGGLRDTGVWQTDGTFANSIVLKRFNAMRGINGYLDDAPARSMRKYNGEYYFLGYGTTSGNDLAELWKLNPISNVFTKIVAQPTSFASCFTDGKLLTSEVFDGKLYFIQDAVNPGIYSTDGTVAGTTASARTSNNNFNKSNTTYSTQAMTTFPDQLKTVGNSLYFNAGFNSAGSSLWRITNPTLGQIKNSIAKLSLYPNPTGSSLNLIFSNSLEKATLKIFSILGQTVLEKHNLSGTNVSIDVSGLSNGNYIIQVKDNGFITTSKFIKQ